MARLKILYSPTSPFAAKARMIAAFGGFSFDQVMIDPSVQPSELLEVNPLGKVPVLVNDEDAVFDSRLITTYLDELSVGALHGDSPVERFVSQKLEALSDGVCDCLLAHVMERRLREPEQISQSLLDRYWGKVSRSLSLLEDTVPGLPRKMSAGQVALRCMLAYLDLRFSGEWEQGKPELLRWQKQFDADRPDLLNYLPRQS
ncbi:glutathione S-transferase family protein [Salinicola rhizosphaerae]|uniref:Glutathione S-transferase n=1 Tax=Salinicola rhizosphaerae TaxID=1443141 RepID=A0ABQ3EHX7_9GAMM|nr:glutathione S-transferase family protein [Salinicola rhizosphaerae]GHB34687.1 glutathione S-transferase [Salinicola rhizosphaerae]